MSDDAVMDLWDAVLTEAMVKNPKSRLEQMFEALDAEIDILESSIRAPVRYGWRQDFHPGAVEKAVRLRHLQTLLSLMIPKREEIGDILYPGERNRRARAPKAGPQRPSASSSSSPPPAGQ